MERDRFVIGLPLGRWVSNTYIVGDRAKGECVLVDAGETATDTIPGALDKLGVTCQAILLTHGHIDHFWSAPDLSRKLDVPVFLHPEDKWLWDNPAAAFVDDREAGLQAVKANYGLDWDAGDFEPVKDGQSLVFGGITFDVKHNPGHTPGHATFLGRDLGDAAVQFAYGAPDANNDILFSGDLIFEGSIGRTDFPRGSIQDMFRSLVDTVLPLEDDTVILSGHGGGTTVGRERSSNPFLRQAISAAGR